MPNQDEVTVSPFLKPEDLRELTGYAVKAKQIEQLRRMGIAFFVNGCGRPVVTYTAIEGRKQPEQAAAWKPAILTAGRNAA